MNILESHIEGAQEFEPREREQIYRAIIEYLYYGDEPDYLKGGAKGYFIAIKPTLDTHHARREAGKKGGRPKKQIESNPNADEVSNENQTEKQTKTKLKSKRKPNWKANGKQSESKRQSKAKAILILILILILMIHLTVNLMSSKSLTRKSSLI